MPLLITDSNGDGDVKSITSCTWNYVEWNPYLNSFRWADKACLASSLHRIYNVVISIFLIWWFTFKLRQFNPRTFLFSGEEGLRRLVRSQPTPEVDFGSWRDFATKLPPKLLAEATMRWRLGQSVTWHQTSRSWTSLKVEVCLSLFWKKCFMALFCQQQRLIVMS